MQVFASPARPNRNPSEKFLDIRQPNRSLIDSGSNLLLL